MSSAPAPSAVARPPARDLALMVVAVAAVATSAPLIAATAAPALAIAFWRNAFGAAAVAPWALLRHRGELRRLTRWELRWSLGAGTLLALHFGTWIPSLELTTVASSTALVATQPVWAALIARASGHHVPRQAWWGMAIAFAGVLVLTGIDFSLSARALVGDLLALVGAVFAAGYVSVGARVRPTVSTTPYTLLVYGSCALLLLAVCLVTGRQLAGYTPDTWVKLLALTAGAQLLGHSLFNVILRTTPPTVLSLAILFEMPGAALIAALWLGQTPPWGVLPAAVLLLVGVAVVVRSQGRDVPPVPPPD